MGALTNRFCRVVGMIVCAVASQLVQPHSQVCCIDHLGKSVVMCGVIAIIGNKHESLKSVLNCALMISITNCRLTFDGVHLLGRDGHLHNTLGRGGRSITTSCTQHA